MKRQLIQITCLYLLLNPFRVCAEGLMLPEFTVEYLLKKDNTEIGRMTRSLSRLENGRYRFESSSKTTGFISLFYKNSINESTDWRIRDQQFIADEYHYLRIKRDKKREVYIRFDWDRKEIITSVNDSTWKMPIRHPVYDKLLYQVAIMYDLTADRPVHTYHVADGGRIKKYSFEPVGREVISTPVGELEAVKLVRHKENRDDKAVLWCAPALHYLPIRVDTIEDDGSVITASIRKIEGLPPN